MRHPRYQRGITLIGFAIVLSVVGFFAYLVMRIGPAYIEYYNVVTAMKGVAKEPGSGTWTPRDIQNALDRRMYINYVDENHVNARSFEIKRKGGKTTLRAYYEVREDLFYNLDFVATFDKTIDLSRGGNFSQ